MAKIVVTSLDERAGIKERVVHVPLRTNSSSLQHVTSSHVATGLVSGHVVWWSPAHAQELALKLKDGEKTVLAGDQHSNKINSLVLSPDGLVLATASTDTNIKVWNVETQRVVKTLQGHTRQVYVLAFSPDSAKLASSGLDHTIRVWCVTSAQQLYNFHYGADVFFLKFSPDGTSLLALLHRLYYRKLVVFDVVHGMKTAVASG